MDHPKEIGDRTTLAVMLALRTLGYSFSVPFGENTRYDLIVEADGEIQRVQCKTGWLRKGAIEFPTSSSYYHHPNEKPTQRHYRGQVDADGMRGQREIEVGWVSETAVARERAGPTAANSARSAARSPPISGVITPGGAGSTRSSAGRGPPHWSSPDTYPEPQAVAAVAVLIPSVVLNRMSAYRLTRDPKRPNVDAVPHRHNWKRMLTRA